jgi:hypothetical protein
VNYLPTITPSNSIHFFKWKIAPWAVRGPRAINVRPIWSRIMPYPRDPQFAEVEALLRKLNVPFRRTSIYQLKIGRRVSYYPGRGSISVDGESKGRAETGVAALRAVLRELGEIRRPINRDTDGAHWVAE